MAMLRYRIKVARLATARFDAALDMPRHRLSSGDNSRDDRHPEVPRLGRMMPVFRAGWTLAVVAAGLCAAGWVAGALLVNTDARWRHGVQVPSFADAMGRVKSAMMDAARPGRF